MIIMQTAGILYCGDLGAAFGRLLRRSGWRVVTTCEERSPATRGRAEAAGIGILPRFEDVVRQSHLVFSFVLPAAAFEVARRYAECSDLRPAGSLFVDGNSIGFEKVSEIETLLDFHGVPVVDATI